jgi:hypothetical protein
LWYLKGNTNLFHPGNYLGTPIETNSANQMMFLISISFNLRYA